ncbi:hypothetical protein FOBRF1_013111 [Fusarium oxysporum]
MDLASIYFGLFLGVFVFTFAKAVQQTRMALWATQTQLLPQIVANRVALIVTNKRRATKLKLGLVLVISVIAVSCIWTVAQLDGAAKSQVHLNYIFEKAEKAFFLVVDLALNLYFLYLVRFRLIADGLGKYWRLFNFNVGMMIISTSMAVLLLGFLSLPNPYLYVQFAPLAYISKLYIELPLASLISKVVRTSAVGQGGGWYDNNSCGHKSNPTNCITPRVAVTASHAMPKSSGCC